MSGLASIIQNKQTHTHTHTHTHSIEKQLNANSQNDGFLTFLQRVLVEVKRSDAEKRGRLRLVGEPVVAATQHFIRQEQVVDFGDLFSDGQKKRQLV